MAALQSTSRRTEKEGATNSDNEATIDYVELLRISLAEKKLTYIVDILEQEDVSLEHLLEWHHSEIVEALRDVHDDQQNQHQIRAIHRNKFAKIVTTIAKKRDEFDAQNKNEGPSPSSPSNMKLLIIGKEEEEAIEAIQNGEQYMAQVLTKMQESLDGLHANTKKIKTDLHSLCNDAKQAIDKREKQITAIIDNIQKYKLNKLMQQTDAAQAAADTVHKFYSEYKGYFQDESLTKQDRKDKLLHAKTVIEEETLKTKQYKHGTFQMNVAMDKQRVFDSIQKCFALQNTELDLPKVTGLEFDRITCTLKWSAANSTDEVLALFDQESKDNDDEKKTEEDNAINVCYQILYQEEDQPQADNAQWNVIHETRNQTTYELSNCIAKVRYHINDLLQSPDSDPISIKYVAKWSSQCKGSGIDLSENDTKALMARGHDHSVRAQYPIKKGMIVTIRFTAFLRHRSNDLFGVVASNCNGDYNVQVWNTSSELYKHSYGLYARSATQVYYS
eukprot:132658_1